jgi:hypothetical protein
MEEPLSKILKAKPPIAARWSAASGGRTWRRPQRERQHFFRNVSILADIGPGVCCRKRDPPRVSD